MEEQKNYTVYMHRNKINDKAYIGLTRQSAQDRWRNGKGYKHCLKFNRAIEKYGWDNFEHIIICEGLSEEEASKLEIELIEECDTINNGYNISLGGSTTNHSQETLQKMSRTMKGRKLTEETKEKIKLSKEQYRKKVICVETNIEYPGLLEAARQTGIDASSISRVCKGKQGEAGGFHWYFKNEEAKAKQDKRKSPVKCLTTGVVYESAAEAARQTGSDNSNIRKVCNGIYKSTNGLKWASATIEEYKAYQSDRLQGEEEDGEET